MGMVRTLFLRHRRLAALLLAMTLCMKAFVPAGYMVGSEGASLTITICDAQQGGKTLAIALPGKHGGAQNDNGHGARHCPYATLGMQALGGADPALLAAELAFILLLGFAPLNPPALRRTPYATPPLRGPPAQA